VPDVDGVVQVEVLDQVGQVVGVVVKVVALAAWVPQSLSVIVGESGV